MKKILVINGNPKMESFCKSIAKEYISAAQAAGAEVKQINVGDYDPASMAKFEINRNVVNPDVKKAQEDIIWAEHIVIVHPVWWGSTPAMLKGFIDSVFASGFAFRYVSGSSMQEKLLKGKTAHIITTMDTPWFIYRFFFGAPSINQLKSRTLEFCGISPVKVTHFGPVQSSTDESRAKFLQKVNNLGKNLA